MGLVPHVSQLPMSLGLVAHPDFQPTICLTVPMQCHVQPLVHAPWVYYLHVVCTACMLCALPVSMACMLCTRPGRVACLLCARPACCALPVRGVCMLCARPGRVAFLLCVRPACCALPVRGVCMLCALLVCVASSLGAQLVCVACSLGALPECFASTLHTACLPFAPHGRRADPWDMHSLVMFGRG